MIDVIADVKFELSSNDKNQLREILSWFEMILRGNYSRNCRQWRIPSFSNKVQYHSISLALEDLSYALPQYLKKALVFLLFCGYFVIVCITVNLRYCVFGPVTLLWKFYFMIFCLYIFLPLLVFYFDHCQMGTACSDQHCIFVSEIR